MREVTRIIGIDAGHRLMKHEGKCAHAHGHRYTFEVTCAADALDEVGRVIDFSKIKEVVGGWLDEHWDHGFIAQIGDPIIGFLQGEGNKVFVMQVPPTAENLSEYLAKVAARELHEHGITVTNVRCWETPNCYADSSRRS